MAKTGDRLAESGEKERKGGPYHGHNLSFLSSGLALIKSHSSNLFCMVDAGHGCIYLQPQVKGTIIRYDVKQRKKGKRTSEIRTAVLPYQAPKRTKMGNQCNASMLHGDVTLLQI